ncbi:hypothetical protein ACFP81_05340 [Deinococcus lacus]|uniref:Uncharacterized protein n=1 Tax=Deinococcus lacus TaxID=392561 RepID=A0ABW1YB50_9DEIO
MTLPDQTSALVTADPAAPAEVSGVPPRVPPLWAAAAVGATVGWLNYLLMGDEVVATSLQRGLLALLWSLGLGTVFLNLWGAALGRWVALLALGLMAGLVAAGPSNLVSEPPGPGTAGDGGRCGAAGSLAGEG